MIRTLIIDDEMINRRTIRELLENHFPGIDVVGEAEGVQSGLEAIQKLSPDLVMLDIRLQDGDAFDLLNQLGTVHFKIIFVTAYEEYALKAIKFSALDYLLKPVLLDELQIAIHKAENQILQELNIQISELSNNLKSNTKKRVILKTLEKLQFVDLQDIIRCEADKNYTTFYLKNGKKIMVSSTMKEYEDMLCEQGFFRAHRSHIINLSYVDSYIKSEGGYILMSDGSTVPVALGKKNQLIELIGNL